MHPFRVFGRRRTSELDEVLELTEAYRGTARVLAEVLEERA